MIASEWKAEGEGYIIPRTKTTENFRDAIGDKTIIINGQRKRKNIINESGTKVNKRWNSINFSHKNIQIMYLRKLYDYT